MPDLFHSLQGRDLGHLRIISSLWGIELSSPDAHSALPELVNALLEPALVTEVSEALPSEARQALKTLVENEGRMPWALFSRRFGSIRDMGPGRRDRERPFLSPASPAEVLWYRALVARAFLKPSSNPRQGSEASNPRQGSEASNPRQGSEASNPRQGSEASNPRQGSEASGSGNLIESEAQEFAYIPDEFLQWLPSTHPEGSGPDGRPASPGECAVQHFADDHILDLACTALAALRLADPSSQTAFKLIEEEAIATAVLHALLAAAGLVDANGVTQPEPTRAFLEAGRGEALAILVKTWRNSPAYNELRLTPGLSCEGEWRNDPLATRQALLDFVSQVPIGSWWSLPAFTAAIHQRQPDFQRPAGDYDSWFIRDTASGLYLRGAEHWEEVDGALIRFFICGPLHWLGILDLAGTEAGAPPTAFRFSAWAADLLQGKPPTGLRKEDVPLQVSSDGRLRLPVFTPRAVRYQIARFCQWEPETQGEYRYRITPVSLERARGQGLRITHLVGLLRRHAAAPPAPSLIQALDRWEEQGAQATFEKVTILRVATPEMMNTLRRSPAGRFLGDPLSATSIIVKDNAVEKVLAALAQMGYLADARIE